MDLMASCRDKLAYFRVKELKDVLNQLGMSKQGKKQDLVERILSVLAEDQAACMWARKNSVSKEEVSKLVDDIYRKMQVSGATELASKGQGVLESSVSKVKGEVEDSLHFNIKVRCLCGSSLETDSMIKCEDSRCQVWQHIGCVIIPEKPMDANIQLPEPFYCELCRLSRADPFWVSVEHRVCPVKLVTANIPTDGTTSMQTAEKTFSVTRSDKELLAKQEYELQAWCMLLNDKVQFRMQWPQYSDMHFNGTPIRVINRPGSQLLGSNGRDDGSTITQFLKDGFNKISLTWCDARAFCLGVRIVKRRTVQQILNMIPKESEGEQFVDALARVRRCVGGGNAADTADSDSDIEVVADSIGVNLRCPMSGSRMKVAGRFKLCVHMGCFDLDVFVEMNQRSRKWQCPICLKNYSLENLIIDPYFNRVTSKMRHCSEDLTEIEVKPDGSWRVKCKTEVERRNLGELARWHNADSSSCVTVNTEQKLKVETDKQIKLEGFSDGKNGSGLNYKIRKNTNGLWELSKSDDINTLSSNHLQDHLDILDHKVIPMSSSATGSGRDGEDPSVNQDGGGNIDVRNNGIELDSLSLNVDPVYGFSGRNFSAPASNEVIIIGDSDDDNDLLMSSGALFHGNGDNGEAGFQVPPPVLPDHYSEDHNIGNSGSTCLGLYPHDDDFGMPLWPIPAGHQSAPGFQLFNSDVSQGLVDLASVSMNGYGLPPDTALTSGHVVPDSSLSRCDTDINDGLVDNPLAFGAEDPALQIFLPTRPSDAQIQSDMRHLPDLSNGIRSDDWISLTLGGASTGHGELLPSNNLNSTQQMPCGGNGVQSLTDAASLLLDMNDARTDKGSRQRSGSPFSFPRQKRSVRPRLYLSIDSSDSE